MKKSRHSTEKIIRILREADGGATTEEVCREHNISSQTFYRWRKKYGGLEAGELRRLKELERENARLKTLVADLTLDKQVLQEVLARKV